MAAAATRPSLPAPCTHRLPGPAFRLSITACAELGIEKDDKEALIAKYHERLEGKEVPAEVQKTIDEELAKLSSLESASSEFNVTRNYLDWLSLLPWGVTKTETLDPSAVRAIAMAHGPPLSRRPRGRWGRWARRSVAR